MHLQNLFSPPTSLRFKHVYYIPNRYFLLFLSPKKDLSLLDENIFSFSAVEDTDDTLFALQLCSLPPRCFEIFQSVPWSLDDQQLEAVKVA